MRRFSVFLLLASAVFGQTDRNYHRYLIADLAAADPANWHGKFLTHIEIEGWVSYVAKEADGDLHIRLCDSSNAPAAMDAKHCIVAEVMPTLTPKGYQSAANWRLKKGMHLIVRGIGRYDAESPGHHWWECHPIEEMEILPVGALPKQ